MIFKKLVVLTLVFVLFISLLFFQRFWFSKLTFAQSSCPKWEKLVSDLKKDEEWRKIIEDLEKKDCLERFDKLSQELEKKTRQTADRARSLSSQIAYMDNQIRLTSLKSLEMENKIEKLEEEIEILSAKIEKMEGLLTRLSGILLNRIVETYKKGKISFIYLLFSSNGFSEFFNRAKYIRMVQSHDKKIMFQVQATKDNYSEQKLLREEKKKETEDLKRKLEAQKEILAEQKRDKEYLLEVTKNDEKKYQALLEAARAEQRAIEEAIKNALALLKNGMPIKKGEKIALIGNTGYPSCSTGTHLHFEIRKGDAYVSPAGYLKNREVKYDDDRVGRMNFTGDWDWPIENPRITQEFGMSYWAKLGWYGGGPHTGIDMTSENPAIKAPKDGILYKGATTCGKSSLKFVAIDHGNNLISWYWHVQ